MRSWILFLFLLSQDGDLASILKKGGWAAAEELGTRRDLRPKLEALAQGKDAEAAWWAGVALAELEARDGAGEAWRATLRVTLEAKETAAGEVLRDLVTRAKGRLIDLPEGDRPITVSFRNTPYLRAVDEVCRQAGLVLARGPGGRLQAVAGEPGHGPRFYQGSFAVSVLSLVRRTEITFREEPSSKLQLSLSLRAEPGLRMLDEEIPCVLTRAEDDTGRSLLLEEGTKATLKVRGAPEAGAGAMLALAVPAPGAKKIALVRGVATVTLPRRSVEVVFENVGNNGEQERESGGVKVSLKRAARTGDEVRVEMELSSRDRVFWPPSETLILEDAEGHPYQKWGSSMNSSGTSASFQITYRSRDGAGPPEKLRVPVVTEGYARKIHFELKDLLLR